MRILIIEDEPLLVGSMKKFLEAAGHEVPASAGSLEKAWELVQRLEYDAVILDSNLRRKSSEPIAEFLFGAGRPFLVVSGYDRDQSSPQLSNAPFLTKPFLPENLLAAVEAVGAKR
jgi:DNA-binding response OmpR family regulator